MAYLIAIFFLLMAITPAHADPLSIGVAILVNIGYGGAISGLGATIVGSLALAAVGFGASLLSNALFAPKIGGGPSPSDRQAIIRQSVGPRLRFYGRVKVGGTLFFFESASGELFVGVTLNEGEIGGVVEYWLNDQLVTTDGDGTVNEFPYDTGTRRVARLLYKHGTSSETAWQRLLDVFPGIYTEAHRLRGVATLLGEFSEVSAESIGTVYPQGNPNIRVVMDASMVTSLTSGSRAPSTNPATNIYDYLTAVDDAGFAYGAGYLPEQVDMDLFAAFAELCDERVPKKDGGTVARYSLSGGYALNEEMRDVLPRMLRTCDADLFLTNEGKIGIRGGKWIEPRLTLDSAKGHIRSGSFKRGQQALAAFNELTITYVEPTLDYQEAEAERWLDATNIALRGKVLSQSLQLDMVTEHAQARRLGKIYTKKNNPRWIGTLVTNFYGMNCLGEQYIRVKFAPLQIDEDFEVLSVRITDDLTGAEISIRSASKNIYDWDAELEEGTGPNAPPDTSQPTDLSPPANFEVSVQERIVSGDVVGLYLLATWDEPEREALGQEVEYRVSPDGPWQPMSVSDSAPSAESGIVTEGAEYDIRIRTVSPAGAVGDWIDPYVTITATMP